MKLQNEPWREEVARELWTPGAIDMDEEAQKLVDYVDLK